MAVVVEAVGDIPTDVVVEVAAGEVVAAIRMDGPNSTTTSREIIIQGTIITTGEGVERLEVGLLIIIMGPVFSLAQLMLDWAPDISYY